MKGKWKHYSWFFRNGLSIAFVILFLISMVFQVITGMKEHNDLLQEYHKAPQTVSEYLTTGHFLEATFENWESEFLQMALFVIFTIFLRQQGSSESKDPADPFFDKKELKPKEDSPWPVKKGGIALSIYKYSLSIALFILFIISFVLHWIGSYQTYAEEQQLKGEHAHSLKDHLMSSTMWFESFQNWQSEFLSIFAIIFLSIYLRQYGSSQSKAVNHPNIQTGE